MSYRTASAEKFTMIEELFDLDDEDEKHSQAKHIRQTHHTHPASGMGGRSVQEHETEYEEPPQLRQHVQMGGAQQRYEPSQYEPQMEQQANEPIRSYTMPHNTPTCLEIADHVANCPICSKFYNNDPTIYIIAILILSAVCIVLLKKVLDSK